MIRCPHQDCHFYRAPDRPSSRTVCYLCYLPFTGFISTKVLTMTRPARQRQGRTIPQRGRARGFQLLSCNRGTFVGLDAGPKRPKISIPGSATGFSWPSPLFPLAPFPFEGKGPSRLSMRSRKNGKSCLHALSTWIGSGIIPRRKSASLDLRRLHWRSKSGRLSIGTGFCVQKWSDCLEWWRMLATPVLTRHGWKAPTFCQPLRSSMWVLRQPASFCS